MPADDEPLIAFATLAEFEAWVAAQPAGSTGLWLKLAKKSAGVPSITYAEALDVALCYGWIDGVKATIDESYWKQRFTPRRPRSKWSKINTEKVAALTAAGRMRPGGQREVDAAKADGRWEAAYHSQSANAVPPELQAALDADPAAAAAFAAMSSANRYAMTFRVHDAKRPETKAKRVAQYIAMLHEGRLLHP
jgi:uncharacterized protein YdeI (YjbR/CyaY-like superfamily)